MQAYCVKCRDKKEMKDAREKVEIWRKHYDGERSHGALGNLTPTGVCNGRGGHQLRNLQNYHCSWQRKEGKPNTDNSNLRCGTLIGDMSLFSVLKASEPRTKGKVYLRER